MLSSKSLTVLVKPSITRVRVLIRDVVRGEETKLAHHSCDSLRLIFSVGIALSHCIKQVTGAFLSVTQQIYIKCSSLPGMVLAAGDTVRNKTNEFPEPMGLNSLKQLHK